ncbi:DUF6527 family protein [Maricaulis maris]|uniref:DUF6527 family protein n=1 Tax=Maricaulis maris TaxID=74318 RepID=UPI003A93DF16
MKNKQIKHEFVDAIPEAIEPGTLYVSVDFATAVHLCECGCGLEVVTPLSRTDWKLIYDGETVSLHPSIGNWSFPCRSHYWIRDGQVQWAGDMHNQQITQIRQTDRKKKAEALESTSWLQRKWAFVRRLFR